MSAVRMLVTSGSARRGSFNLKLARVAAQIAREQGATVTELDLRALVLPLYDGDIEAAGMPAGALELRRLFAAHDALLVATPEYNANLTPLLLNALDWASRPKADGDMPSGLDALGGTVAGLVSASPGRLGGLRSVINARAFLSGLGLLVVPQNQSIPLAHQAFDEQGALKDAGQHSGVARVVQEVLRTAAALKPAA
jgi:chromate reductase, NAD(P)H dehydrogenase (quinone)